VYRKFHDFVTGPFKGEAGFIAALDKACRRFINTNAVTELLKDPRRSPELIAKYSDQLLQKSNKDASFQVLEPLLNDIVCSLSLSCSSHYCHCLITRISRL